MVFRFLSDPWEWVQDAMKEGLSPRQILLPLLGPDCQLVSECNYMYMYVHIHVHVHVYCVSSDNHGCNYMYVITCMYRDMYTVSLVTI